MNDCELLGRHCELAVSDLQKPQKSALRPDGGVVTQRTANPHSASRIADKFARFTLRSPHGFVRATAATANFWSRSAAYETAPASPGSENEGLTTGERVRFNMANYGITGTDGFVYFIQEGPQGAIKIGWSIDPVRRMTTMQIGNSRTLRVLGLITGRGASEWQWHSRFAAQRIGGEWFKRTPELLAAIKEARTHTIIKHVRDGRTTRDERVVAVERPSTLNQQVPA